MFKTPPIPAAFKEIVAPAGHINPLQFLADCPNLFGTETLCGDWDGDLLLVAQDFAPASQFLNVLSKFGPVAAWRHNDGDGRYGAGGETNPRICGELSRLARHVDILGQGASSCGVLYINACFFLTNEKSTPSVEAYRLSLPIVQFVLAHMVQLKTIACLGKPAFDAMGRLFGCKEDWKTVRDSRRPVVKSGYRIHALSHPGSLGTVNRLRGRPHEEKLAAVTADWAALAG